MIKILVVDDEPGICDSIKRTFTYIGFFVLTARTGQQALAVFEKERPQIVFLDIFLPDANGIELLTQMKKADPGVIVMMVTARQDDQTREQAAVAGADEFIIKPFSQNYLRDTVVQKIGDVLDRGGHAKVPVILLVDDEQEFRVTIRDFIMGRYECVIEESADGAQALVMAGRLHPDIIFLDIKMPGVSGIEVISEMAQVSPGSKVIVISAWKSAEVVSRAVSLGAADYISKPVSLAAFGEKLKALLISMGKYKVKK